MEANASVYRLLERTYAVGASDTGSLRWLVQEKKKELDEAKEIYKTIVEELRAGCEHLTVLVPDKRSSDLRLCFHCGLQDSRPMVDPGDEYVYATYGAHKVLKDGTPGREFYQVAEKDLYAHRSKFSV